MPCKFDRLNRSPSPEGLGAGEGDHRWPRTAGGASGPLQGSKIRSGRDRIIRILSIGILAEIIMAKIFEIR